MDILASTAATTALAIIFVHLRHPATDLKMFDQKPDTSENAEPGATVDDLDKPVGVRVYTPGSTKYRKAQAAISTANIQRGRKALNGTTIQQNEIELLSKTTVEFVNLSYLDLPQNEDTFSKFYGDVRMVAFKDQIAEAQADLGNAYKAAANS